jgi:uncharacterized lipoprotein YddW (UPF0748 family)
MRSEKTLQPLLKAINLFVYEYRRIFYSLVLLLMLSGLVACIETSSSSNDLPRYLTPTPVGSSESNGNSNQSPIKETTDAKVDEALIDPQRDIDEIRGVWVQAESINTQENIDEMLRQAEAGGFNAVFVDVFLHGQAMYDSELVEKYDIVSEDFNPLSYLVAKAHSKGIQVHGWFVAGSVGYHPRSPLDQNPEWALVGADGRTTGWLNYTRPDVRQFTKDLMVEVIERYQVDGIHFDYTRYPGPEWGFDPYSIDKFREEYGLDLDVLRYADLPAYGRFEGNPLILRGSAKVLASFSNGYPAVTLNKYGEGEVVLLNWDANKRRVAIGTEIIQRSIQRMRSEGGQVFLLNSKTNAEEYGHGDFERGEIWLQDMGWEPIEVVETEIDTLGVGSVLVLPNVYLISPESAQQLASFVEKGGGVIFIDGPTRSIKNRDVRAIIGMNFRGKYFNGELMMESAGEHPLVPSSGRRADLQIYQDLDAIWKEFRKQGINQLIQETYQRVIDDHPQVVVSVTVTRRLDNAANEVLQDWNAWLEGGYIDLLIPRFYVDQVTELIPLVNDWDSVLGKDDRINIGIITYFKDDKVPKSPEQLLAEIELIEAAGSNGIMLFDLDNMSDEQLQVLGE